MLVLRVLVWLAYAAVASLFYVVLRFVYALAVSHYRRRMRYGALPALRERWAPRVGAFDYEEHVRLLNALADADGGKMPPAIVSDAVPLRASRTILLTQPDDLRWLLNATEGAAPKGASSQNLRPMLGDGLVTSKGAHWHAQRKLLTPLFHFAQLKRVAPVMVDHAYAAMDGPFAAAAAATAAGGYAEPKALLERLTLDIIIAVSFGRGFDAERMSAWWQRAMDATPLYFFGCIVFGPKLFVRLPFKAARDFIEPCREMRAAIRTLIERRRAAAAAAAGNADADAVADADADAKVSGSDLLECMVAAARAQPGGTIDVRQIEDEALTFLLAGHETSSTLLSWTVYYLSKYPQTQRRAQAEIASVLRGARVAAGVLPQLQYVRAALDEALRLRPPAPTLQRTCTQTTTLPCGVTVYAGDGLAAHFTALHTCARVWGADAREYKPERWLGEQKRSPWTFLPFSGGPRNCIGSKFAIQESMIILVALLQRYDIELDPTSNVTMKQRLTLQPRDLRVRFVPRQM